MQWVPDEAARGLLVKGAVTTCCRILFEDRKLNNA